jgi:hypothetical protein
MNEILAIISILSICATFFFLGQAYEIMKQCRKLSDPQQDPRKAR